MPFPSNPRPGIFAASPGDKNRSFIPAFGDKAVRIYPRPSGTRLRDLFPPPGTRPGGFIPVPGHKRAICDSLMTFR